MTEPISQRARAYLAAWHSRRPTLALMGEFSSGKSALLNCLLDRALLPTRATATDMPAIWISHGATEKVTALGFDGHLVDLKMDDLTEGRAMQYLCIRIEIDAEILQRLDIIDTPGISDPRLTTEIVEEVARNVDFVVWCSPMTQAWRQTERAFWTALPDAIKPASILALTRADLIASSRDIDKVIRRCVSESDGSFAAVLPVAAPLATQAKTAASAQERAHLMQSSGLPVLLERLKVSTGHAEKLCAARTILDEPAGLEILPLTADMRTRPEAALSKKKAASPKTTGKNSPKRTAAIGALLEAVKNFPPNGQGLTTIRHHFNQMLKEKALTAEHRDVLVRALSGSEVGDLQVEKFLKQVQHEVQDFADGPWCDLRQQTNQ